MTQKPRLNLTVSEQSRRGLESMRQRLGLKSISELVDKLGGGSLPMDSDEAQLRAKCLETKRVVVADQLVHLDQLRDLLDQMADVINQVAPE